jgi:sortase A
VTLTQTAVERERLLVPVAPRPDIATDPEPESGDHRPEGETPLRGQGGPSDGEAGDPSHSSHSGRRSRQNRRRPGGAPSRQAGPWLRAVQVGLAVVAIVLLGLVAELTLVSGFEHRAAQVNLFNRFRSELALGTAPLGPVGRDHRPLPAGAPIALLTVPSIGVRQVVQQGTSGAVLADGPGHLRSTVFPGGEGTSVVLGRAHAYGGPFARIADLRKGARITVVTQSGTATFRVVDQHRAGSHVLGPVPGTSRLELGTATGPAYAPSGVTWVDADKIGPPMPAFQPLVHTVPAGEQPLGTDSGSLWLFLLGLEMLIAALAVASWSWRHRGHVQTWLVFTAPVLLIGVFASDQLARFLPNLT